MSVSRAAAPTAASVVDRERGRASLRRILDKASQGTGEQRDAPAPPIEPERQRIFDAYSQAQVFDT